MEATIAGACRRKRNGEIGAGPCRPGSARSTGNKGRTDGIVVRAPQGDGSRGPRLQPGAPWRTAIRPRTRANQHAAPQPRRRRSRVPAVHPTLGRMRFPHRAELLSGNNVPSGHRLRGRGVGRGDAGAGVTLHLPPGSGFADMHDGRGSRRTGQQPATDKATSLRAFCVSS